MEEENKNLTIEEAPQDEAYKKEDWFKALVEDCKSIVVEHEFTARWTVVEGYHALGKRIAEEKEKGSIYGKKLLESIAFEINKKESSIQKAMQFYEKYPDLEIAPFGKDVSWFQITQKYLPQSKKEEEAKPIHKDKIEPKETVETPATAPRPIVDIEWDSKTELWKVTISKDSFIYLDVVDLKKQLDEYIESLRS